MKKKFLFALGCVSIVICIYGLLRYRVASWFLFLLLGLYLIFYDKVKPLLTISDPATSENKKPANNSLDKGFRNFDVVGVSFSNEDGTKRQHLLKKIYFRDKPFDNDLVVELERYFWEDKPAYYVKVNGFIIGNIEAEMVHYFEKRSERPCELWIEPYCHCDTKWVYSARINGKYLDITD